MLHKQSSRFLSQRRYLWDFLAAIWVNCYFFSVWVSYNIRCEFCRFKSNIISIVIQLISRQGKKDSPSQKLLQSLAFFRQIARSYRHSEKQRFYSSTLLLLLWLCYNVLNKSPVLSSRLQRRSVTFIKHFLRNSEKVFIWHALFRQLSKLLHYTFPYCLKHGQNLKKFRYWNDRAWMLFIFNSVIIDVDALRIRSRIRVVL